MSSIVVNGFDIVRRFDGCYNVYDYAWWPDDYLDNDMEANYQWLTATFGWRAKGWHTVHVAPTQRDAITWARSSGR